MDFIQPKIPKGIQIFHADCQEPKTEITASLKTDKQVVSTGVQPCRGVIYLHDQSIRLFWWLCNKSEPRHHGGATKRCATGPSSVTTLAESRNWLAEDLTAGDAPDFSTFLSFNRLYCYLQVNLFVKKKEITFRWTITASVFFHFFCCHFVRLFFTPNL